MATTAVTDGQDARTGNVEIAIFNRKHLLDLKLLNLSLYLKAGFRSDQPRVPAGNPGGGQWTDEEGDGRGIVAAPEEPVKFGSVGTGKLPLQTRKHDSQ